MGKITRVVKTISGVPTTIEYGHTLEEWRDLYVYPKPSSYEEEERALWDFSKEDLETGAIDPIPEIVYWYMKDEYGEDRYFETDIESGQSVEEAVEDDLDKPKESTTTFLNLELGVLWDDGDPEEIEFYKKGYDHKHAYYDETYLNGLEEDLETLKDQAKRYVEQGVNGTYGIITKVQVEGNEEDDYIQDAIEEIKDQQFIDNTVELFDGEQFKASNVVYSIYKDYDGNIKEDFVEVDIEEAKKKKKEPFVKVGTGFDLAKDTAMTNHMLGAECVTCEDYEDLDKYDIDSYRKDDDVCIYQFPASLTDKEIRDAKRYNLTYVGKVSDMGYQPGDHVIRGTYKDLKRYCDSLDYVMHPDYLYLADEFDVEDVVESLNEGYVGQTVEDFMRLIVDPSFIDTFIVSNIDADDYEEAYHGPYDEMPYEFNDAEYADFDVGGECLNINVSLDDNDSGDDYYDTLESLLEDYNGDEIRVIDVNTGETLFEGDKSDIDYDLEESVPMSIDTPKYLCVNAHCGDVESDDGLDESKQHEDFKVNEDKEDDSLEELVAESYEVCCGKQKEHELPSVDDVLEDLENNYTQHEAVAELFKLNTPEESQKLYKTIEDILYKLDVPFYTYGEEDELVKVNESLNEAMKTIELPTEITIRNVDIENIDDIDEFIASKLDKLTKVGYEGFEHKIKDKDIYVYNIMWDMDMGEVNTSVLNLYTKNESLEEDRDHEKAWYRLTFEDGTTEDDSILIRIRDNSSDDEIKDYFQSYYDEKIVKVEPVGWTHESLEESMKSEVTKWWKDVEDANKEMKWEINIDNGDYSDVEAMHAAMFDMLDNLKEKGAFELFKQGKKIYNKYAKYSKYNEDLKEDFEEGKAYVTTTIIDYIEKRGMDQEKQDALVDDANGCLEEDDEYYYIPKGTTLKSLGYDSYLHLYEFEIYGKNKLFGEVWLKENQLKKLKELDESLKEDAEEKISHNAKIEKKLDDLVFIEFDEDDKKYYLASDYDRYVWTNFDSIKDAEDFYKYHKSDVRWSISEELSEDMNKDESLKEEAHLGRYEIEYWQDEEARDQGLGDIAIETFDDLEDAKEYADKLFGEVASVEVLDTQDENKVVYGRYPEDESLKEKLYKNNFEIHFTDANLEKKYSTILNGTKETAQMYGRGVTGNNEGFTIKKVNRDEFIKFFVDKGYPQKEVEKEADTVLPKQESLEESKGDDIEKELKKYSDDFEYVSDSYDDNDKDVMVFATRSEEAKNNALKELGYRLGLEDAGYDEEQKAWCISTKAELEEGKTSAQKYNDNMHAMFRRYNEMNDAMANFLGSHGVSQEEVDELRKNTGLHGNALLQKLIDLGIKDEFFASLNECSSKKECKESIKAWSIKSNPINEDITIYINKDNKWEEFANIENCPTKGMLEEEIVREYSPIVKQLLKDNDYIVEDSDNYCLYRVAKNINTGKKVAEEKVMCGSRQECKDTKKQLEDSSPEDSHHNKNIYVIRKL